jgi:hypothetical protein
MGAARSKQPPLPQPSDRWSDGWASKSSQKDRPLEKLSEDLLEHIISVLPPAAAGALCGSCRAYCKLTRTMLATMRAEAELTLAVKLSDPDLVGMRPSKTDTLAGELRVPLLKWSLRNLTDADCSLLVDKLLRMHPPAQATLLSLFGNSIAAGGVLALADAVGLGALPRLTQLVISNNPGVARGGAALKALQRACRKRRVQLRHEVAPEEEWPHQPTVAW